jgi:hypothetical protein
MGSFPEVTKNSVQAVPGRKRVRKILGSLAVAAGITGVAVVGAADMAKAAVSLGPSAEGALVFAPAELAEGSIAYHSSHSSHWSHSSHMSHYSSRW